MNIFRIIIQTIKKIHLLMRYRLKALLAIAQIFVIQNKIFKKKHLNFLYLKKKLIFNKRNITPILYLIILKNKDIKNN